MVECASDHQMYNTEVEYNIDNSCTKHIVLEVKVPCLLALRLVYTRY